MSIMIREYCGYNKFDVEKDIKITNFSEAFNGLLNDTPITSDSLMVDIEGIHAYPYATRNYTRYMPECLQQSVASWTKPYRRPLIKHHNEYNGEIIGRICNARYVLDKTFSCTPTLVFTANIPEGQAKKDVQSGLLETVSIGIDASDVRCSICGHQIADNGPCPDHDRGQMYDNNICYWDIYSMEAKELSYVIVPSDMYAKNICTYPATQSRPHTILENMKKIQGGKTKMTEQEIENLKKDLEDAKQAQNLAEQAKVETEKKLEATTETIKKLENDIEEFTKSKTELEKKIDELTETNNVTTEEATREKAMRETLEGELAKAKEDNKTDLIEAVQAMRTIAGKTTIKENIINSRSEESLRDSIKDLKEEFQTPFNPQKTKSPILADPDKNHKKIKENNDIDHTIDLQAGLESLFASIASTHNKESV